MATRRHANRRNFFAKAEQVILKTPWALLLLVAVTMYAIIAHARGDLGTADFVNAFIGGGLLAIGHGVHHAARKLSRDGLGDKKLDT